MACHVITREHGGLPIALQDDINDVRVVIDPVVRRRVRSTAKRPRGGFLHHISPLSGAKPILASDDDDVAVVRNVRANDVLAHGEGDGFRIDITGHVDTAGRGAAGFSLNGLHRARLARTADGHFPCPVRMHLGIGTGKHGRTTVGSIALVDVNLNDLMAEAVGQAPYVGHLVHGENELCVPGTLAHREVGRVPEASTAGRVEVGGQRINVVAIACFIAHRIVEFEQRDPFLKVREDHFGWRRRRHLSIGAVAVGQRISP